MYIANKKFIGLSCVRTEWTQHFACFYIENTLTDRVISDSVASTLIA